MIICGECNKKNNISMNTNVNNNNSTVINIQ